jgi:hypothetical protein
MAQPKKRESNPALPARPPDSDGWVKPQKLPRWGWGAIGLVILASNIPLIHYAFFRGEPEAKLTLPYRDGFDDSSTVQEHYFTTGGFWRVQGGELLSPGVKNNPLWLKARLPQNVAVQFKVRSASPEGDIRAIIFGDGVNYQLSGYHLIQGGWNNSISVLARLDENAPALDRLSNRRQTLTADSRVRVESSAGRVQTGKQYLWLIERRGNVLRWSIDGQPFLELDDPFPLKGTGHDRFGFVSGESDLYFDDLIVEALDQGPFPARQAPAPIQVESPGPFADRFDRTEQGPDWLATDPAAVRIEDHALVLHRAHNHPVWLIHPIPENASIEFDAWSDDKDGDLKVEAWGDGHSSHTGPPTGAYTSSGYVFVFGGWQNTSSVLAKQHEHGTERTARNDVRVEAGKHYHWQIRRQGGEISWSIDGQPFLLLRDGSPLRGLQHQYFAFSDWESKVHFANLKIHPL